MKLIGNHLPRTFSSPLEPSRLCMLGGVSMHKVYREEWIAKKKQTFLILSLFLDWKRVMHQRQDVLVNPRLEISLNPCHIIKEDSRLIIIVLIGCIESFRSCTSGQPRFW